jgi:hypothetical protein
MTKKQLLELAKRLGIATDTLDKSRNRYGIWRVKTIVELEADIDYMSTINH